MPTIDQTQVEELLEDVRLIRSVINKNRPVLQQVLNFKRFRLLMLLTGISIIGFSLLVYFLSARFGGFQAVPGLLRYAVYLGILGDTVFLQLFKQKIYLRAVREIDPALTLGWWLRELFSHRIMHLYIPMVILMIVFCVYFILCDISYYIIPMLSMAMGLTVNMGALVGLKPSLIGGYWLLTTGILAVIFPVMPGPITLCLTLGCGSLLISGGGIVASRCGEGA